MTNVKYMNDMHQTLTEYDHLNINFINLMAIDLLEIAGNTYPSESQIRDMERRIKRYKFSFSMVD